MVVVVCKKKVSACAKNSNLFSMTASDHPDIEGVNLGCIVEFHGLKNATQYNGEQGVVIQRASETTKNRWGICLKNGKHISIMRKNLILQSTVLLDENFWYSFSHCANDMIVEKNQLMFQDNPFCRMTVEADVLLNLFYESASLMLPVLKKWENQADIYTHLVTMLDRKIAEYWLAVRKGEEWLGDDKKEIFEYLMVGVHSAVMEEDMITKMYEDLNLRVSVLYKKENQVGFLDPETFSRMNFDKEEVFKVGIENTTDNLDDYNVEVEIHKLDMKSYQKPNGKLWVFTTKNEVPILASAIIFKPRLLNDYINFLEHFDDTKYLYLIIMDNCRLFVTIDEMSACFVHSQYKDDKPPCYRITVDDFLNKENDVYLWGRLFEHWDWGPDLVVELPPCGGTPAPKMDDENDAKEEKKFHEIEELTKEELEELETQI